jgi:hypothetical protein
MHELIDPETLASICPYDSHSKEVLKRLKRYELKWAGTYPPDEEVWTLLFAYGFIAVEDRRAQLAQLLIEGKVPPSPPFELWLEMSPIPPRGEPEWNSIIDLVAGNQRTRKRTKSGIEYEKPENDTTGWVCMTEVKWLQDIAVGTSYDPDRNQLAKVIENALTFQKAGKRPSYPEAVHVTLLTPARFKPPQGAAPGVMLYSRKFNAYTHANGRPNVDGILNDINKALAPLRTTPRNWKYPKLDERINSLHMHWVTFEDLLAGMPDSEYKQHLTAFVGQFPVLKLLSG